MLQQQIEALGANNRINLLLFDATTDEGMACTLSKRRGRNVLRQFAHIHDVRRMQIEKRGRKLGVQLESFPAKEPVTRAQVRRALVTSGKALDTFFAAIDAGEVGCMPQGPITYLAYFMAHEAHHRGSILLTLKTSGHAVPRDIRFGLWGEWSRRS